MTATAKLFMHGRSQAVRLPKEFRFEGSEVRVSKVGDEVILEPIAKQPIDFNKSWAARCACRSDRDFLPDGIPDDPPLEPDPRVSSSTNDLPRYQYRHLDFERAQSVASPKA